MGRSTRVLRAYPLPAPGDGQGCRPQTPREHEELRTMTAHAARETPGCPLPPDPDPSLSGVTPPPLCQTPPSASWLSCRCPLCASHTPFLCMEGRPLRSPWRAHWALRTRHGLSTSRASPLQAAGDTPTPLPARPASALSAHVWGTVLFSLFRLFRQGVSPLNSGHLFSAACTEPSLFHTLDRY